MNKSVLLIYTGGTIGMKQDPFTQALQPFDFEHIMREVPELKKFGCKIDSYAFSPVIDSSNVVIEFWVELAQLIENKYEQYDGFVILHGTDTMAYSASMLSFMLRNLEKPIVFTGSQLPIGMLRTDGKENLISAIEIASTYDENNHAMVPEVSVFFQNRLYRGNRCTKYNADAFEAFRSPNFPPLAEAGITIKYNKKDIIYPKKYGQKLEVFTKVDRNVAVLKIFPGIRKEYVRAVFNTKDIRAVVIETFGSGNAPSKSWFMEEIEKASKKGIIILNITQCLAGSVNMSAYATGQSLKECGVVSGLDSTTEAAITKLFHILGNESKNDIIRRLLSKNLCGEITI